MSDEINLGGKIYISSKRASASTGYAQDYIGQLARKGAIDAQRIGGLWYIQLESLTSHKERAITFVPQLPKHENTLNEPDSLIFFDGKDYVSALKAAEITGYHPDYVGQLAREGKVLSQQIGNRWYVDRAAILAHKEEKDGLLAAVQAESVGLANKNVDAAYKVVATEEVAPESLLTYTSDADALMPDLAQKMDVPSLYIDEKDMEHELEMPSQDNKRVTIPIRIDKPDGNLERRFLHRNDNKLGSNSLKIVSRVAKFRTNMVISLAVVAMIVLGTLISISGVATSRDHGFGAVSDKLFTKVGDVLEPLLTQELVYNRQN